jgi:lipoprotein-releasing system permease protein
VAALIIVLSVMNGFQKEVRDKMLSVVAHVEVLGSGGAPVADAESAGAAARRHPEVLASAPFVAAQALISRGDEVVGAMVRGIDPAQEVHVTDLASQLSQGSLSGLIPGEWGIVLGRELAFRLRASVGDKITLVAPSGQLTPAGVMPRLKQFTVTGTFSTGHYQYDSALALIQIDDASKFFRVEGVSGVQLKLRDLHRASQVGHDLQMQMGSQVFVRDWTRTNRQWFSAVQVEKRLMAIILILIVAVASFNLVSTLVMTVTDKRADIAILRTLGASPRSVMGIFMVQGATSGVIGTLAGVCLGLLVAFNVQSLVQGIEKLFGVAFLDPSIYLITRMPSDPQSGDILPIVAISLVLAFLATLYPSWRASRVHPAEALRYE